MRSTTVFLRRHAPELGAAMLGVVAVLLVAVLLQGPDSSGASGRTVGTRAQATPRLTVPAVVTPPRSRAPQPSADPAVRAATTYLGELGDSAASTSAEVRRVVDRVIVGPLRARAEQTMPLVVAQIHARLSHSAAPYTFEELPLGYRVGSIGAGRAEVAIWHLDIGASSALPLASATYTTTTYGLRYVDGSWRIESIHNVSGPTPPGGHTTAATVDAFARAAGRFSRYRNVP